MSEQIYNEMMTRALPILKYKREVLSAYVSNTPFREIGIIELDRLEGILKHLSTTDISGHKSISMGFSKMLEVWMGGDFNPKKQNQEFRELVMPILSRVRAAASEAVGHRLIVHQSVIDVIDDSSCIIPHSDDFTNLCVSLRVHVPLITSPDALGLSFHPDTLEPSIWRGDIGKIYAFNNFEPHTVVKVEPGIRAHLICDMMVAGFFGNTSPANFTKMKKVLRGRGPTASMHFNPNGITHSESNFDVRNRLAAKYGGVAAENQFDHLLKSNIEASLIWMKRLAVNSALYKGDKCASH